MLDEFGAFGAGDDEARGNFGGRHGAVGAGNGIAAAVIPAAGEGIVDLAHDLGGALVFDADDDAIRIKEIGDGGAFAEKFGIGGDIEVIGMSAVAQNDGANPLVGVDGDGTFFDDDFVVVDGAGDFAGDGFDVRHVGVAALGGGSADGDEDGLAVAGGGLEIAGEFDAMAAMAGEELGEKFFVNGDFAGAKSLELLLVVIDQNDLMPEVGETGTCNQTNVSRTDDCDAHKRAFSLL